MTQEEYLNQYTAEEIDEMLRRGESKTDWARFDAITDEELEASIDHEDEGEFDWSTVYIGMPGPKQQVTIRFDADVIAWFRAQGLGYQARMNAALRGYVDAHQKRNAGWTPRRQRPDSCLLSRNES